MASKKAGGKTNSIIAQVAAVFLIGILTTGILSFIVESTLSGDSIVKETERRAGQIAEEVRQSVAEFPAGDWLLRYWYENAGNMDIEYDAEYEAGTQTEEKTRLLSERYPGFLPEYADEEQVKELSEADRKLYAEIAYSWLITRINQIKRSHDIDYLFCVASAEPHDMQFFLFSAAEKDSVRGTSYEEVYPLGHTVTVTESQKKAMDSARLHSNHLADAGEYVDYYDYLCSIDGTDVFIGLTFNMPGLRADVEQKTKRGTNYAILNQVCLSGLCLTLIFFVVLRPLRKVQKNIRLYRTTKDSSTVVESLSSIKTRNEISELASDVSDLACEMDHHVERIRTITAEKERVSTELSTAAKIQESMLPSDFPAFPDRTEFDVYAVMDPAKEVGGDFYDFFLIDDDHLCLVMADVSGKGVPAALFMMASKIILANNAMMGKSPAQTLADANTAICANNQQEMFVTIWLGILEISTGRLTAANAGHEYPVLQQPGGSFELFKDRHGFVVGGMEGVKYKDYELKLKPGARLFLYTDGVPEATSAEKELFGTDRMLEALNSVPDGTPEEILRSVRLAVDGFVLDAEQFDDLTMLCLEYRGPAGKKE